METIKTNVELISFVNEQIKKLSFPSEPERLYAPVKYILGNSGKRLRSLLFLQGIQLFTALKKNYFNPAVGLEIFHNFTLIHDDIMDHADVRRSQPTIHKKWDENVAILSGDVAMIMATQCFFDLPETIIKPVLGEFNKMALEICEGQQYDMDFETRKDVTVGEYLEMIRLKTAVFLASALKMGAIVGGASSYNQDLLYNAGLQFGMAFQLQDDYLDTFGDLDTFGKKPGGDILEKKKTFLLINALEKATQKQRKEFWSLLNDTEIADTKKIDGIKKMFEMLSVDNITQKSIENYFAKGFYLLKKVDKNNVAMSELQSLFQKLIRRTV